MSFVIVFHEREASSVVGSYSTLETARQEVEKYIASKKDDDEEEEWRILDETTYVTESGYYSIWIEEVNPNQAPVWPVFL